MIAIVAANLFGCEVDTWLFDPSKPGRYEFYPTTIPVLDRIDVIEPQEETWSRATSPTSEDLLPRELAYYVYPGDVLTLGIFELYQPSQWATVSRQVDAGGYYRVPELGDVRAAGLTVQQFEDIVKQELAKKVMQNPQVDVVVEKSGGLRYTVYGYVANPGVFHLDNPELRLLDALAIGGGVPSSTENVYVIRQVVLEESYRPSFAPRDMGGAGTGSTTSPTTQRQPADIESLIRQLDKQRATTQPAVSPGMLRPKDPPAGAVDIDQLEPVRKQEQPPVDVDVLQQPSKPNEQAPTDSFIYVEERGEWVRVPGKGVQPPPAPASKPVEPNVVLDRIIAVDYRRLSRGDSTYNIVIRPNDRIFVEGPDQGFVYVDGEVSRPGVYQLPNVGRLTLSRFITAAGGLGSIAEPTRIDLVRVVASRKEAKIRLDLAAIRQGTEPDIYMKPDDHIIVGTSFWATPMAIIRNGFRTTYGFGFLLDRNFGNDVFGPPPEDNSIR